MKEIQIKQVKHKEMELPIKYHAEAYKIQLERKVTSHWHVLKKADNDTVR